MEKPAKGKGSRLLNGGDRVQEQGAQHGHHAFQLVSVVHTRAISYGKKLTSML